MRLCKWCVVHSRLTTYIFKAISCFKDNGSSQVDNSPNHPPLIPKIIEPCASQEDSSCETMKDDDKLSKDNKVSPLTQNIFTTKKIDKPQTQVLLSDEQICNEPSVDTVNSPHNQDGIINDTGTDICSATSVQALEVDSSSMKQDENFNSAKLNTSDNEQHIIKITNTNEDQLLDFCTNWNTNTTSENKFSESFEGNHKTSKLISHLLICHIFCQQFYV